MKANYEARIPRGTLAGREIIDKYIDRKKAEAMAEVDDRMNGYATAYDATTLLTLHWKYGFDAEQLRQFWEDVICLRADCRTAFRDDDYEEQRTGKNIEDTAILEELRKIGVDLPAWEKERVNIDPKTGEVTFH